MTVPRKINKKNLPPCLKVENGELYVREATEEVYAHVPVGAIVNLQCPNTWWRRGKVPRYDEHTTLSPTIMAAGCTLYVWEGFG